MPDGPDKLILRVEKAENVADVQDGKLASGKVLDDIKPRLDGKKDDIFEYDVDKYGNSTINGALVDKINTILHDVVFQAVEDGATKKVYYTTADGKRYELEIGPNSEAIDIEAYFSDLFSWVVSWLADEKMKYLETGKAEGQPDAINTLNELGGDVGKLKQKMLASIDFELKSIWGALSDHQEQTEEEIDARHLALIKEAEEFTGDANQLQNLETRLIEERDKLSSALAVMSPNDPKKAAYLDVKNKMIDALAALPEKYIDAVIKQRITNNKLTPKPNPTEALQADIAYAIGLIESEIGKLGPEPLSRGQKEKKDRLERKRAQLQDSGEQLSEQGDDAKARDLIAAYEPVLAQTRTGLGSANETVLRDKQATFMTQKRTFDTQKDALLAAGSLSEPMKNKLLALTSAYNMLEQEFTARIYTEQTRSEIIATEAELKALQNKKGKKKEINELETSLADKRTKLQQQMDQLQWYGVWEKEALRSTATFAADKITWRLEKGYEVKTTTGKLIKNERDLEQAYKDTVPMQKQKELISAYVGKTIDRANLWPLELEYIINYKQIQVNANNDSRAEQLQELTKMDREFNNLKIGTGRDMRILAEDMNRLLKDEKTRAKYTKKAFESAFTRALLEAYNKQHIMQIEHLLANNRGLKDMQPMPEFFGAQDVDVWWPPYYLATVAQQRFWPNRKASVKEIVGGKLYRKYIKDVVVVDPYLYPTELGGTNVNKPGFSGDAMVMYDPKTGTRQVEGRATNESLLGIYLAGYKAREKPGWSPESKLITNPKEAYNLIGRWFTEGMDVIGMVQASYMADWLDETTALNKANEVVDHMLQDAIEYDDDLLLGIRKEYHAQTDYYRAAHEQMTGQKIMDKDVRNIPEDKRHRMMSRAAVRWFASGFCHGQDAYGKIEQALGKLYGGSWNVPGEFVTNSNKIVGQNVARLIDEQQKEQWYALSWRSLKDFWSVDNVLDQIQKNGIFGAWGNAITALLQQTCWSRMQPQHAQMLWSTIGTVAKVAAVLGVVRFLRDWSTSGTWFWWKAWRFGVVGVGLWWLGPDAYALAFGGKWWYLADGLRYFMNNKDDFDQRGLSSSQMLSFTFGKHKMSELFSVLEVKDGKFVVADGKIAELLASPSLWAAEKDTLKSMLGWSADALSEMIHAWLTASGVTVNNYKQVLATSWNEKVSAYINAQAVNGPWGGVPDALNVPAGDPLVAEVEEHGATLSGQEKQAFQDRLGEMVNFWTKWRTMKVYAYDYLLTYRSGLVENVYGEAVADAWKAWFQDSEKLKELRKQYVLQESPFDASSTEVDFLRKVNEQLFAAEEHMEALLQSSDVLGELKKLTENEPGDSKVSVDLNDPQDHESWFINRQSVEPKYKELLIESIPKPSWWMTKAFVGIEEGSWKMLDWSSESFLVFWVQNSATGSWEQRQLQSVGDKTVYTNGVWYVPSEDRTSIDFAINLLGTPPVGIETPAPWEWIYSKERAPTLLWGAIAAAEAGQTEIDLARNMYADGNDYEEWKKVVIKKTGQVRWGL